MGRRFSSMLGKEALPLSLLKIAHQNTLIEHSAKEPSAYIDFPHLKHKALKCLGATNLTVSQ